jgi:hypothetical protein
VAAGTPLKLTLTPLVAEKAHGEWRPYRGRGMAP